MKRQYLNVLYSPTAAFKGRTQGLCGFMDNNATNDFMGPDETVYEEPVQFAESCKQLLSLGSSLTSLIFYLDFNIF